MTTEPVTPIQACLNRLATGDPLARAELFRVTRDRLLVMTRALMARFSRLRSWVESEDVLHNALLRLDRTLGQIPLNSTQEFLSLASLNVRRELLDLVRHYFGAQGLGTNYGTPSRRAGVQTRRNSRKPHRATPRCWPSGPKCTS